MDDVVAVELVAVNGVSHHVITFGRIQAAVDEAELLSIVRSHASGIGLGDATSIRLCGSLQEAREAPYFFEALISFGASMAARDRAEDRSGWRSTIDQEMRGGRHLYYLGDPEAEWFQPPPGGSRGDNR